MTGDWTALAWLAALFIPLFFLKRWLSQHLHGVGLLFSADQQTATLLHYFVLLPGIILHELSHLLAAALVGVKTKSISLYPSAKRGGSVRFGAVIMRQSDPFRESWIGLAPLLTGSAAILLLARWQFGVSMGLDPGHGPLPALRPDVLLQNLLASLQTPDAWLWLYLIFAISNAMLPSESDRQPWWPVLLFLALTTVIFYVSGLAPQIPMALKQWVLTGVTYLAFAFGLAISVDIPFALLIFTLEKLGERMLHRRVEY